MSSKKKMYAEKYYNLTEDEMQELIARAKKSDGSAQLKLIEIFSNFLTKYVNLLFYGKYSQDDYDIRRFIGLFVTNALSRRMLLRNKMNISARRDVDKTLQGITYMVQRYGDIEDIEQTVNMTFLQCVDIYKRKGEVPFSGYLYSYFFYLMKKNVQEFLIDQTGRKTFPLLSDEDNLDDWNEGDKPEGFTAPPEPSIEELLHADIIDEHWVYGETAFPPFDRLNVQERQLIKWRFVNGERSSDIANKITEHPNTVREHFNKIRTKLVEAMQEDLGDL